MNTSLRCLLSLIIITSLTACNENSSDPIGASAADTTKPQIRFIDEAFAGFIKPPLTGEVAISVTPFPENKITANDDSGTAILAITKVTGLNKSQVSISSDNTISFNNITANTPVGVGHITLRATDKSGNFSENEMFFSILPNIVQTPINIKKGESITIKYSVLPNIDSVLITQPIHASGISASAYLANSELFITFTANNDATVDNLNTIQSEVTLSDSKLDDTLTHSISLMLAL
ncbi:hypothetical protein FK216_07790 [Moraxellaceae bacterium AER2_44_116]|nr:hypothetical protein [Moraxellaceae bacterium]TQC98175.1 hypothetical protein FK216_07790 [Moraxellaceae bacterium AER2_44_116]